MVLLPRGTERYAKDNRRRDRQESIHQHCGDNLSIPPTECNKRTRKPQFDDPYPSWR